MNRSPEDDWASTGQWTARKAELNEWFSSLPLREQLWIAFLAASILSSEGKVAARLEKSTAIRKSVGGGQGGGTKTTFGGGDAYDG